jgi:mRNA-degrading endonuclease YafQ of YafQ-DinJ toxin-antitoxin module
MSIIQIGMDTDKVERDITKAYIIKLTDRISELESKLAGSKYTVDLFCVKYKELEKELSRIVSGLFSENELAIRDLEHTRQGFWLGFEDARCHPDEMNILQQWEGTKRFNQAKALKETK